MPGENLQRDLAEVLNYYSAEQGSDTPDFILATFLLRCLEAFNKASRARETWFGTGLRLGGPVALRPTEEPKQEQRKAGEETA